MTEVRERRGIPAAAFVEDVQTYLDQLGLDVSSTLAFLNERYALNYCEIIMLSCNFKVLLLSLGIWCSCTMNWWLQQYRLVEMKLLAQQRELQAKIPDIEKCLDIVAALQKKKGTGEPLLTDFEVSEGIYSRARIEDSDSVCLWLGANVMLEYSCEEADSLLQKNLENAKASLDVLVSDLQFLRDQVTITQVTVARVYNWDVHHRRQQAAAGASGSGKDA